jgi:hypothetical protein
MAEAARLPEIPAIPAIGRREAMLGAVVGLGAFAAGPARACTVTGVRISPFSDRACRAALQAWIDLLNVGPELPIERITRVVDDRSLAVVDEQMVAEAVGPSDGTQTETDRTYLFYQKFRISNGRPDPEPIRLTEINMIRRLRNRASYQFAIERHAYVPAFEDDGGSCTGSEPEHYAQYRTSYIASFTNNRLGVVRQFPEWYLEERA